MRTFARKRLHVTNKAIAQQFQLLGDLMELHDENKFKIRSYQNAYRHLRKYDRPLVELSDAELQAVPGVGKAIQGKIRELVEKGTMDTLERYRSVTPGGVQEMLRVKGLGPKKVKVIWKELGAESVGELLYACVENRLIELKGFGAKTQADIQQKLEYFQQSKDKFRYATLAREAERLLPLLRAAWADARIEPTGALRRGEDTVDNVDLLVATEDGTAPEWPTELLVRGERVGEWQQARSVENYPVRLHFVPPAQWGSAQFLYTGSGEFLTAFREQYPEVELENRADEATVFAAAGLPAVPPALRVREWGLALAADDRLPDLIEVADIRGVVHAHTTYSDGIHTLRQMAEACIERGYEYLVLTDHSQSAFYADGLRPGRVRAQWAEVDALNAELAPFRIFKSIESDIKADGSLDYDEELLAGFDCVIASVHSNLKMDEAKATQRLLTAIQNPHTTILGHPTGRLLLSRPGYPIDHVAIIDACAAHGVSIELNANPYRLDMDWSWIPYAIEKGIKISINPDAHSMAGIDDIRYGVVAARKGGLTKADCLNALGREAFATAIRAPQSAALK